MPPRVMEDKRGTGRTSDPTYSGGHFFQKRRRHREVTRPKKSNVDNSDNKTGYE